MAPRACPPETVAGAAEGSTLNMSPLLLCTVYSQRTLTPVRAAELSNVDRAAEGLYCVLVVFNEPTARM